jgi:hypothetical protein
MLCHQARNGIFTGATQVNRCIFNVLASLCVLKSHILSQSSALAFTSKACGCWALLRRLGQSGPPRDSYHTFNFISHNTHHTSHITHHTSHLTPHSSHLTPHTSHHVKHACPSQVMQCFQVHHFAQRFTCTSLPNCTDG